ncbi:MAG: hypothetical protein MUP09_09360 [Thiovulaceae bacterium]|nr:hypothetical protein [Sulfurimonadaceae bacterium]
MKLVKMSLLAATLIASSAFAVDNVKVSGDAQLFYSTSDSDTQTSNAIVGNTDGSLFDKDSSAADAALHLGVTADLAKNDYVTVSAGLKGTLLSTLSLENNLVSNVWGGAHTATATTGATYANAPVAGLGGAKVENASWFNEAWVALSAGKSTAKLGRMELDTPLAFTETWSIEQNSFEAAVLINQDLPDTTLVAAYVGNGNGTETFGQNLQSNVTTIPATLGLPSLAVAPVVNGDGKFATYGTDGAYTIGAINNSWKPLTAQAWYYDVSKLAQAYWLQADLNLVGILAGAQYSGISLDKKTGSDVSSDALAVMLGYEMKDVFTVKGAYSQIGTDFTAGFNTATSSGDTKLYTKTFWNYGFGNGVTAADTTAYKVSVSSPVNGLFDASVAYTSVDQSSDAGNADLAEIALVVKKSFGPLDTKLAVINVDDTAADDKYNMVQAYLTLNF